MGTSSALTPAEGGGCLWTHPGRDLPHPAQRRQTTGARQVCKSGPPGPRRCCAATARCPRLVAAADTKSLVRNPPPLHPPFSFSSTSLLLLLLPPSPSASKQHNTPYKQLDKTLLLNHASTQTSNGKIFYCIRDILLNKDLPACLFMSLSLSSCPE